MSSTPPPHTTAGQVKTAEDVREFWEWLTRSDRTYLAVDTETTGLDWWSPSFRVRLVQFGDTDTGWTVSYQGWPYLVRQALDWAIANHVTLVFHNVTFDALALSHPTCGITLDWSNVEDTMVWAHLLGYAEDSRALKTVTQRRYGSWAVRGQKALEAGMAVNGWTWATVPEDYPGYGLYASVDTILTAMLWTDYADQRPRYQASHDLEIATIRLAVQMMRTGITVDCDYLARAIADTRQQEAEAAAELATYGITLPSQNEQVTRVLKDAGLLPPGTRLTETGKVSVAKDVLAHIDHPAAAATLSWRWLHRLRVNYLEALLRGTGGLATGRGVVHPEIRTMEARTGRMCLPDTHRLVTARGPVPIDEVAIGDLTLDEDGSWVQVQAIHRYQDQPVQVRQHEYVTLESTEDHRWVTESERGRRRLEPLGARKRQCVILAPDTADFDFHQITFDASTDTETFAAIVGLLVSDGRCHQDGNQLRAFIYQTEHKFYKEIIDLLPPEAVMYDRITNEKDHHEIRLRTRWLRSRLESSGLSLRPDSSLRHHPGLTTWVLSLSTREVAQFFRAVWLADGRVGYPTNPQISCGNPVVQEAVRLAAYRLGRSTSISIAPPGEWGTQSREVIGIKGSRWWTRSMITTSTHSDVWCVSTSTGTFTAWSPTYGPYLTGNSIAQPALQQLPRDDLTVRDAIIPREPDHALLTCDYSQIEMRMFARLTRDTTMLSVFQEADATGGDFFVSIGREVYQDPDFQKKDPRRTLIKNAMYGAIYTAGVEKMAEVAGVGVYEMAPVLRSLRQTFPSMNTLGRELIRPADGAGYYVSTGLPGFTRDLRVRRDERVLTNYLVQGTSADVLKLALVRLDAAGLGPAMVLPVHDEIVLSVPRADFDSARATVRDVMSSVVPADDLGPGVPAEPSPEPLARYGDGKR